VPRYDEERARFLQSEESRHANHRGRVPAARCGCSKHCLADRPPAAKCLRTGSVPDVTFCSRGSVLSPTATCAMRSALLASSSLPLGFRRSLLRARRSPCTRSVLVSQLGLLTLGQGLCPAGPVSPPATTVFRHWATVVDLVRSANLRFACACRFWAQGRKERGDRNASSTLPVPPGSGWPRASPILAAASPGRDQA